MAPQTPHARLTRLLLLETRGLGGGYPTAKCPLSNPKVCSANRRPKRQCSREVATTFAQRAAAPAAPAAPGLENALAPREEALRGTTGRSPALRAPTPRPQPLPRRGGPPHATRRRLPAPPPRPATHARVAAASCSWSAPRLPAHTPRAAPPGRGLGTSSGGGRGSTGAPPSTS